MLLNFIQQLMDDSKEVFVLDGEPLLLNECKHRLFIQVADVVEEDVLFARELKLDATNALRVLLVAADEDTEVHQLC